MTIGLLDPALFLPRDAAVIERELSLVLDACIRFDIRLVPLKEYWPALWRGLGQALEPTLPPKARRALQELRKSGSAKPESSVPPLLPGAGTVWHDGFKQLFATIDNTNWVNAMEAATLRAVATGEDVVIFVRRVEGRNLLIHRVGNTTLDENTRWVLHVQSSVAGRKQVLCVHHPRNMTERWSTRFDWRLPCSPDARFPFCVPFAWWKRATPALGTMESKPCWIDQHGNGWARPNINVGAGYHWDVYIKNNN